MPWPERRPPNLEELILYVVGRSRDRGATLTRTKLVKLVYLIDVARAEGLGRTLTDLRWRFLHYGPYAPELGAALEELESREAIFGGSFGDATLYQGAGYETEGHRFQSRQVR
ncbi:MAG: type II toxin-antitoxin system antitoxin SocA domain-containing protein [Solirubrobacterales bacterium]